jgi:hypothetical protein
MRIILSNPDQEGWQKVAHRHRPKKSKRKDMPLRQGDRAAVLLAYNTYYRRPTHAAVYTGEGGAFSFAAFPTTNLELNFEELVTFANQLLGTQSFDFNKLTFSPNGKDVFYFDSVSYQDGMPQLPEGWSWLSFRDLRDHRNRAPEVSTLIDTLCSTNKEFPTALMLWSAQ